MSLCEECVRKVGSKGANLGYAASSWHCGQCRHCRLNRVCYDVIPADKRSANIIVRLNAREADKRIREADKRIKERKVYSKRCPER